MIDQRIKLECYEEEGRGSQKIEEEVTSKIYRP